MVKWTDGPTAEDEPPERARFGARLRVLLDEHAGETERMLGVARGLLAVAIVVSVVAAAMSFGVRGAVEPGGAIKAPTFAKLPARRVDPIRPPSPVPATSRPSTQRFEPFVPVFVYLQDFAAPGDTPAEICSALKAIGFAKARWAASAVFAKEWECASPLLASDGERELGFLVLRGSDRTSWRNLMLKLNPASPEDRLALRTAAQQALVAVRALPTPAAMAGIDAWKAGEFPAAQTNMRLIAEYGQPDRRVVAVALPKTLPRPDGDLCDAECRSRMAFFSGGSEGAVLAIVQR